MLGLGNILLHDEGVGVRVIERLQKLYSFPPNVRILDGGTLGMDLLPYVEAADRLVVIDALDTGAKPGTITRLEGDTVPSFVGIKMSPHQMGLADLLAAAHLCECCPTTLVLWGIQPQAIDLSLDLSPKVAAQVPVVAEKIVGELRQWGIEFTQKGGSEVIADEDES